MANMRMDNVAQKYLEESTKISTGKPSIHRIKTVTSTDWRRLTYSHQLHNVGEENTQHANKVILLIGAVGTGKTTLANAMANYVSGVRWRDDFRFILVQDDLGLGESYRHTPAVTAYKMNFTEGFKISSSLTIIDTPGFKETGDVEENQEITQQIMEFLTIHSTIAQVDAVCFVVQASLVSLSTAHRSALTSIHSIFGKETKILFLITFADEVLPPVLCAIKEADIKCTIESNGEPIYFTFNNSALFANNLPNEKSFNKMFWTMGEERMETFFDFFFDPETILKGLKLKMKDGLTKLEKTRKTHTVLKQNRYKMEANIDFYYEIETSVAQKVSLKKCVTYCYQCDFICHSDCKIEKNEEKYNCVAMDKNKHCTECHGKCVWNVHINQPWIWKYVLVKEKKSFADLKRKYGKESGDAVTAEEIFKDVNEEYWEKEKMYMRLVSKSSQSLKQLHESAKSSNVLSEEECVNLMILTEKKEAAQGYEERIKTLQYVLMIIKGKEKMTLEEKETRWNLQHEAEQCRKESCFLQ
ncbi:uncharacterized protein O3C94_005988 [Discoglossus pictus]